MLSLAFRFVFQQLGTSLGFDSQGAQLLADFPSHVNSSFVFITRIPVQGSKRFLVQWVSEETAEQFRERVSLLTGVPAEKQQLKLADKQLLGEGQTLLSQYEVNGAIRLIWLEDLRSPQERGEKGETILDKIGTLWKLDNITILSLIVVAVEFVKDLLPVLLKWGYPMPY
ncbi:unnamed protein product [Polarella glacialis]|uniref:Ubiquitin-like domain-containing protein n=1 Tax=Polarella glacialis TaxID=89957 RepID=A0A813LTX9_POLGL|nr:unnamed protein product [Polarella glacialis]